MNVNTYELISRLVVSDPPTASQANGLRNKLGFLGEDPEPERMLSRRDVAKLLDCHPNTVDNLRKRDVLKVTFVGNLPRYRKTDVEKLLQKGW